MELLSEDDLNLKDMTPEELDKAWDLWFDLAQATNDFDPPYTHGVFVLCDLEPRKDDGNLERLIAEGRVVPARLDLTELGPPPEQPRDMTISEALAAQREER
jgi:hypothetical protein